MGIPRDAIRNFQVGEWGSEYRYHGNGKGFRGLGIGTMVEGIRFRVQGSGFRGLGIGTMVKGIYGAYMSGEGYILGLI